MLYLSALFVIYASNSGMGSLNPLSPPSNKASACGPSRLIEFNNCSDKLALKGNFLGNIFPLLSVGLQWLKLVWSI
jgi:hypothetical protein